LKTKNVAIIKLDIYLNSIKKNSNNDLNYKREGEEEWRLIY
jgi:hypothetical protein